MPVTERKTPGVKDANLEYKSDKQLNIGWTIQLNWTIMAEALANSDVIKYMNTVSGGLDVLLDPLKDDIYKKEHEKIIEWKEGKLKKKQRGKMLNMTRAELNQLNFEFSIKFAKALNNLIFRKNMYPSGIEEQDLQEFKDSLGFTKKSD